MERRDFLKTVGAGIAIGLLARPDFARAAIIPNPPFNAISKSLWVWQTALANSTAVINLMKAFNINTVFFSISPGDRQALFAENGSGPMTSNLQAFRANGITFYATVGDGTWCLLAAATPGFVAQPILDLISYQRTTGLLDGIAVDIQPETLPQWTTCQGAACLTDATLMTLLTGFVTALRNISAAYTPATGAHLFAQPFAATLSAFYTNKPDPFLLAKDLLVATASSIGTAAQPGVPVLLAYRNAPDAAIALATAALSDLTTIVHDKWWLGQTLYPASTPGVSYAGLTLPQFQAQMVQLDQTVTATYGAPSATTPYLGIALNDYVSLQQMVDSAGGLVRQDVTRYRDWG